MNQKSHKHQTIRSRKIIPIVLLLLLFSGHYNAYSQDLIVLKVLNKTAVGKVYSFKRDDNSTDKLRYLGILQNKKGEVFKIINSTYISGLFKGSKRASCRILIYSKDEKYLGSYYVGAVWYLPNKIEKNALIFAPRRGCKQATKIDFSEGIPERLYVLCTQKEGDLFSFSRE
ncbi:hypothetical protein [Chitinophaga rhizosphaerae]|uniref:hypothetical protein n=1 Tax=Chitinophaga rhizosphaerae TaxID=1864947 RepID=UPI000F805071|nr:hypothetical protein [Chitinophaga rhizosphaerae]